MTDFLTIKDIVDAIAKAEGREATDKLFQQVKGLSARVDVHGHKLLKSDTKFFGPRGALLFKPLELYRTRLLIAALSAGMEADQLATIARHLAKPLEHAQEGWNAVSLTGVSEVRPTAMEVLELAARAGETWSIDIKIEANPDETMTCKPWICRDDWTRGKSNTEALSGQVWVATTTIPATDLIKPLLLDSK